MRIKALFLLFFIFLSHNILAQQPVEKLSTEKTLNPLSPATNNAVSANTETKESEVVKSESPDSESVTSGSATDAAETASVVTPGAPVIPKFSIWEYQVKGNSVLKSVTIERALSAYLGKDKTVQDVVAAAKQLERVYRDEGYPAVYVNLPEQDVVAGTVILDVVEGKIDRLRVVGSRFHSLNDIKQDLKSIIVGQTLHLQSFKEDLGFVNSRSANLRVTPILKPGRTPGKIDIDIKVKDRLPFHGSVEANNHNSNDTTRERFSLNLGYENLWQRDHSLSTQFQTSPSATEEVQVLAFTYLFPGFSRTDRIATYAVRSNSEVATIDELSVVGNGRIFGLRYVKPLSSTRNFVHTLTTGFDYKDFDDTIESNSSPVDESDEAEPNEISYGMWVLNYNITTPGEKSTERYAVGINFGMRNSLNGESEFANKRYLAQPNFIYGHASYRQTYRLPKDWLLKTRFKLQVSDTPLISNEQFSLGGSGSVRGYHESEIFGDEGVNLGFELRTPSMFSDDFKLLKEFRLLTFVEGAYVKVKHVLGDQEDEISIGGAGFGLRLQALQGLKFATDIGTALSDNKNTDSGDLRFDASLEYGF